MKFKYFAGEQRSPEWFKLRLGKVTASRLEDWLAVSKAKKTEGKPLKKRLDYEKELLFERKFGVSFENFVTKPMQDGIDYEPFVREQYSQIRGVPVETVGEFSSKTLTFLMSILGGIAMLGVIAGGIMIMGGGFSESTMENGKTLLLYSVIGVGVAMLSMLIVTLAQSFLYSFGK